MAHLKPLGLILPLLLAACGIVDATRDTSRKVEKTITPDPPPGKRIVVRDTSDPKPPEPDTAIAWTEAP